MPPALVRFKSWLIRKINNIGIKNRYESHLPSNVGHSNRTIFVFNSETPKTIVWLLASSEVEKLIEGNKFWASQSRENQIDRRIKGIARK